MAKITGNLITDLYPNGTVRMVFVSHMGGGNEAPINAIDLDAAEIIFQTCGLSADRAAELRAELQRNKVANIETSMDEAVAEKFRYRP